MFLWGPKRSHLDNLDHIINWAHFVLQTSETVVARPINNGIEQLPNLVVMRLSVAAARLVPAVLERDCCLKIFSHNLQQFVHKCQEYRSRGSSLLKIRLVVVDIVVLALDENGLLKVQVSA